MQILYEVPGTFRITLVREVGLGIDDSRPVGRRTPFVLNYRIPGVAAAEHAELPDDVLAMYLSVPFEVAKTLGRYIREEFALSDGMLDQLLKAPKELLLSFLKVSEARSTQ